MASDSSIPSVGLDLNDHHQNAISNYMRFAKYLRGHRLRAVDACFEDVKSSRFLEETYTSDEVIAILDDLSAVVRGEVESELINMGHTTALLLQQIFAQAEKWHLKLLADTTHLENQELLKKVKDFEKWHSENQREKVSVQGSPTRCRLEPLNDVAGATLLQQEIDRLQGDNMKLRDRLKNIETQASTLLQDRSQLNEDLRKTKGALDETLVGRQVQLDKEVAELQDQLEEAQRALSQMQSVTGREDGLESNLTDAKLQLLKVQGQLDMAEKELEKKIGQTAAYTNLMKMLQQKNDLVKSLRKKLSKYEPETEEAD